MSAPARPACRLGDECELVSRADLVKRRAPELPSGWREQAGVVQCLNCSTVYEATGWAPRTCEACGREWGESIHDPCLGTLGGVLEACCGHGGETEAYITRRGD